MPLDADVRRALDHVAIQAVISGYSRGQDAHQGDDDVLEQWDRVFTADATTDYTVAGAPACHYRELAAWLRGTPDRPGRMGRYSGWQHMLSLPSITVEGDAATARTDFLAIHRLTTTGPAGARFDVCGAFHDDLVRTPDGWRIRHRRLEVYFGEQLSTHNSVARVVG